ncbi:DUF5709 domain-containing protein [Amycolatopsis acidiphila]|uniref:DUF5709 domain-containing protein n=1 Tax=Amycolatopsis acidiphila TaxID=715473 RepID=A0A558ACD7_9PSEU|nr:DUF5709 domain-containing protein [Amycolatopsis acidiphila]TVT21939.1 hypothetical protein FNH06_15410 [Amycolatopsis acidiphila]UIJ57363.1 DUF5709 domain-containing protein [Amycolatopsis acidiphila]GHG84602.1 hypothetical protein GCM10017788_56820 [Amycolatopsis acidiphila]
MADWPDDSDDSVFEQLDAEDTLESRGPEDPLDEGYTPAERPWAVNDWGTTADEEEQGEGLGRRLGRELPDTAYGRGDGLGDDEDTDGELLDDEVGDVRAGRLIAGDGGDTELYATDVGVDGAGASAEEAAVNLIEDDQARGADV